MGAKSGLALKSLQWLIRGAQFLGAALILGIYAYFLAALHNHNLPIDTSARAVTGIAGAAALYALVGLVLLCCVAGLAVTAFVAMVLDVCFIGCFIYVAVVNKHGAGSCTGYLDTPFGQGRSDSKAAGNKDGFTALPSFHTACRLQTACMAVAIIAIFLFVLSMFMEVALVRHRRKERRFGPSPANNYTSGYAGGGFFGRFRRRKDPAPLDDANRLPEHTHPDQLDYARQSSATENTAVNHDGLADHHKQEPGYGSQPQATTGAWHTTPQMSGVPPRSYRYGDGVYERA
ncbi:uncharacterized protein MAM_07978 [Metarhizium album ARSEF 1941]|uniref:MARVEL domain-containing protein n=1 Tax=Metarhizium album (strain ARSEF 1941) TaxID=1081103 RepID=A0A0B2WJM2_METAS|nr:uncharacterized protein MAM_07978 [Metarhizium album ARSEF 1941]KHN94138.1 hypothetical protein MAM_07978 [Metarhizium album ARSEF 1941]